MTEINGELPEGFKMTELGPLPEEWEVVKLGDIAKAVKGRKPQQLIKNVGEDSVPYLTAEYFRTGNASGFVPNGTENSIKVNDDDIVFIWDGSNAGDVFTGLAGILASTMVKIVPENSVNKRFLYYFFKTKFTLFNTKTTGSTIPHVNKNLFNNLLIPLPPLSEQRKIAAVLSAVQEAKEKTEAVISATKGLKKTMMSYLFTYGPVPLSEAENVPLKETEIGMMPEEWEVVKLGEVFNVQQGKQLSGKEVRDGKIKKPFLRTSNLSWGYINISNVDEMYFTPEEFEKLKLKKGDILVCEGGDIGRTALYRGELKECAYQNHLHRLRPKKDNIDVEFFVFWMDHAVNQRQLYTYTANRTTIPNLSSSRLKNFIFLLPPLPTQQKIASILSAIDQKIEAEGSKKKALEDLFKTLLHNLMTAKIRVNNLEVEI